ncbi:MAG: TldD/PmbA family protein [Prolixibacteraceae bacterium]|nr:TldD/PmbA family protein [Prolixibacteraceae bacterium]
MTKEEKYNLAKWAISFALRNGADQASVSISGSTSSSIEIRKGKTDTLEQANQLSMSIRLFVKNRYSAHSTNLLKKKDLSGFIEEAVSATRYLSEDEFRTLPDTSLYFKGEKKDLKTRDEKYETYAPREKINIAFAAEREAINSDERIISVSAGYYDSSDERILVTSNGFYGDTANSYYGLNASVTVNGGESRPESYWSENSVFLEKLNKEGVGEKAMERALRKIGQRKIASGRMSMIVENRQVSRIFRPVLSAINGSSIQQKNSFLIDKKGEKIFSEKLSVVDDPFIVSGLASRQFDNEGLAAQRRKIVEKGVLNFYYIDTYYGKKLNMDPTNGISTNLVFNHGDKDLQSLIAEVSKGILVTAFNGGNCNGSTGDFSYGIEGFLIEKGEIIHPVSEMNITGNMIKLWSALAEPGNDINKNSVWLTPSLLFEGVDFSGL